jgi:hypothetical protein
MNYARAVIRSNRQESVLSGGIFQKLYSKAPEVFQLPVLYFSAHTNSPQVLSVVQTGQPRADALTYYYSAINKLLKGDPREADAEFVYSWKLSKAAKDLRPEIAEGMWLSAFLSGIPKPIVAARIPKKYHPLKGGAAEIWSISGSVDTMMVKWQGLFQRLGPAIRKARAKRILVRIAQTTEAIKLRELQHACDFQDVQSLISIDEVALTIEKDIVRLGRPKLNPAIEVETALVLQLAAKVPRK